jgi:hypothetical protein
MPFKSDKQRAYMNAAAARGDIKQSVVDEFNTASKGMKLPTYAPKRDLASDKNSSKKKSLKY